MATSKTPTENGSSAKYAAVNAIITKWYSIKKILHILNAMPNERFFTRHSFWYIYD